MDHNQIEPHEDPNFSRRAFENQARLARNLMPRYDFIVCGAGAGTSGSVVARRLAENAEAEVLLIEAGGSDKAEAVLNPVQWRRGHVVAGRVRRLLSAARP